MTTALSRKKRYLRCSGYLVWIRLTGNALDYADMHVFFNELQYIDALCHFTKKKKKGFLQMTMSRLLQICAPHRWEQNTIRCSAMTAR
jgi:hypothetical protein